MIQFRFRCLWIQMHKPKRTRVQKHSPFPTPISDLSMEHEDYLTASINESNPIPLSLGSMKTLKIQFPYSPKHAVNFTPGREERNLGSIFGSCNAKRTQAMTHHLILWWICPFHVDTRNRRGQRFVDTHPRIVSCPPGHGVVAHRSQEYERV